MGIPQTIHFIWINKRPINYGEYASLLSALMNTPYKVYLHTDALTDYSNQYCPYNLILHYPDRLDILPLEYNTVVSGIKLSPSLIADLQRVRILHEYGGIYSDLDIIWRQPLPPSLFNEQLVCSYENPSYKIASNAFIMAEKDCHALTILKSRLDDALKSIATKVADISEDFKYHTFFWKITSEFMKGFATNLQCKRLIFNNGWRRIGRNMRTAGLPFSPKLNPEFLGNGQDKLNFQGITGFHYFNTFFDFKNMIQLPEVRDAFGDVLAAIDRYAPNPPTECAEAHGGQER